MAQTSSSSSKFWKAAFSVGAGARAAAFTAPVVAGYAGATAASIIATNVATGVTGSAITTITKNVIDEQRLAVEYLPCDAQNRFRNGISDFLDVQLDPVIRAIRQRREDTFRRVMEVQLQNQLEVLGFVVEAGTQVILQFTFIIKRRPGTTERGSPEQGKAPRPLPNYSDPNATQTYSLPIGFSQTTRSALEGVVGGAVGTVLGPFAPAFHFIQTAPNGIGIGGSAVGMAGAPSELEKISYCINFAAELQEHINRVIECASLNQVNLKYQVRVGAGTRTMATDGGSNASGVQWAGLWYDASN
jgi:hypothetical protein